MTTGDEYPPPAYPLSRETGLPCGKTVYQYIQPADGSEDSADPHFNPRKRGCGKCGKAFVTSAAFRYYCERCRRSPTRTHTPVRQYKTGSSLS